MRNLRGIIVAGVFGVLTWLVQQLAQRYSLLLDMAYPFASKTVQELLGGWSAGVDFCLIFCKRRCASARPPMCRR